MASFFTAHSTACSYLHKTDCLFLFVYHFSFLSFFLSFANCSRSYISYRIYVSFGNEQDETQSFATPCFIFFNKTSVHLSGNRNFRLFSQSENTAAALQVFNYFFLLRILSVGFNYFVPFVY